MNNVHVLECRLANWYRAAKRHAACISRSFKRATVRPRYSKPSPLRAEVSRPRQETARRLSSEVTTPLVFGRSSNSLKLHRLRSDTVWRPPQRCFPPPSVRTSEPCCPTDDTRWLWWSSMPRVRGRGRTDWNQNLRTACALRFLNPMYFTSSSKTIAYSIRGYDS